MIRLLLALALTTCLTACGGATGATGSTGGAAGAVENRLSFSSSQIPSDGFELTHVEATRHSMASAGKQYPAMIVQMANYDRGGGSYHPNPSEAGQRRVTLSFSGPAGGELEPGVYRLDAGMGQGQGLSVGIEGGGRQVGLYNGEGSGEIVSIDDGRIVAQVSLRDEEGTTIEARFAAEYSVSPY